MKAQVMTLKVEPELKQAFQAVAQRNHRPASQVMRELMRDYISVNKEPNEVTIETMKKSERGEDIHTAKDFDDLCKQLDM